MTANSVDALVIFGATGDLAKIETFPALVGLVERGVLDVPVIGVAKSGWGLPQFRGYAEASLRLNKMDSEFVNGSKQGKIVYIADTNVVVHYLEESRRAKHGSEDGRYIRQGEFSFGEFLSEGVPARLVSEQLGHASVAFTRSTICA